MSPLEKKDKRLGEGKRISEKKISTRTMIKQGVRGGKIDFHLTSKKKTFIDLPKIQPSPFSFLMVHPLYRTAPCNGIRNLGKICLWNPEYWDLESGVQLKESGLSLAIGIENPSSTDKDWNGVPVIRNP